MQFVTLSPCSHNYMDKICKEVVNHQFYYYHNKHYKTLC